MNRSQGDRKKQKLSPQTIVIAVGVLALAVALRALLLARVVGPTHSDEAVGALMSVHHLRGEFTVFQWGQNYQGSHTMLPMTLMFAIFGPSFAALKAAAIVTSSATLILTWRAGRLLVGERSALIGAGLLLLAPAVIVWWSIQFATNWMFLVLSYSVLLMALKLARTDQFQWPFTRDFFLLGVLLGLSFWASPITVTITLPTGLWLLATLRTSWSSWKKSLWAPAIGFVLGALPWIYYTLVYDFATLRAPPQPPSSYWDRLAGFFTQGLPTNLGLWRSDGGWLLGPFAVALYIALLAVFGIFVVRRGRSVLPIVLIAVLYPFILALSPFSWFLTDGRYLLLLNPVIALLAGTGLTTLSRRSRIAAAVVALGIVAASVVPIWASIGTTSSEATRSSYSVLISRLERSGVKAVFTDYWIAFGLTFEARERLIAAPLYADRYPPYTEYVRESPRPAYLWYSDDPATSRLQDRLENLDVTFRSEVIDRYTLLLPTRKVLPEEVGDFWVAP